MSVGESWISDFDPRWVKLANGFAGGIAGAEDVCGALVGAIMVIGALYGRESLQEDESTSVLLAAKYQRRFLEAFSSTNCRQIKAARPGGWAQCKCADTVEAATRLLLDILA